MPLPAHPRPVSAGPGWRWALSAQPVFLSFQVPAPVGDPSRGGVAPSSCEAVPASWVSPPLCSTCVPTIAFFPTPPSLLFSLCLFQGVIVVFPCLLRKFWGQDMEQGNPEWLCASGPMGRSLRSKSRPQISKCGTRGDARAREDFRAAVGVLASVSLPSICPA